MERLLHVRWAGLVLAIFTVLVLAASGFAATESLQQNPNDKLIYFEGFERGLGPDWTSLQGGWVACDPRICTSPLIPHSGDSCLSAGCCAGTAISTRVKGPDPYVSLPEVTPGEHIYLNFWQYYSFCSTSWDDGCGYLQIRTDPDSAWITLPGFPICGSSSGSWTSVSGIDLTEYAGHNLVLSFVYMHGWPYCGNGAWYIDDIAINVRALNCYAGPDKKLCRGDSVQFLDVNVDYGTPPYSYNWSPCLGLSRCNEAYPFAAPDTTTTYVLRVYDSGNPPLSAQDTVTVTILDAPELALQDTTIKVGEELCLNLSVSADSCRWLDREIDCAICTTFTDSGAHILWATVYQNQCSTSDSMIVSVKEPTDVGDEQSSTLPTVFALAQNYPNPFNPTTTIMFDLPSRSMVNLTVYNVRGEIVTTLVNSVLSANRYSIVWNGTSASGEPVTTGIYLYKLEAGSYRQTKKMILLK